MRARLDGALAVLGHAAAPVDDAAGGVLRLQFQPDVERIHRPAGEEVADLARAHHYVYAGRAPRIQRAARDADRGGHLADFANHRRGILFRLFADGERGHGLYGFAAPFHGGLARVVVCRRHGEDVHRDEAGFQKLLGGVQLRGVLIGVRHGHIRRGKAMRMDLALAVARILRCDQRHVAIRAGRRLRRIVKRSRALSRHAARLPVVVIVEAAHPAVAVDRDVQVNLVAGGAILRRLFPHEGLHEGGLVRFRIQIGEEVVHGADVLILAGGQLVERRIFDGEIAVPHAAAHVDDGVARHAAEAGLRLRRIDLFLDGTVEATIEEHRVIVTARAPLAGARSDHVLHVLDGLPVELIVERGEVVHGALPLLVDVLMASAAKLGVHEEVRRNDGAGIRLRRRWREGRMGPAAFQIHGDGSDGGVLNAMVGIGDGSPVERGAGGQQGEQDGGGHEGRSPGARCSVVEEADADDGDGEDGKADVRP